MIAVAVAVAAFAMPFHVTANVANELSPKRVAVVTVRTAPGANCTLTDQLTGRTFHARAANGRITWRWRPSVFANGPDAATVRCSKGSVHRSGQASLLFLLLHQIRVLRDYALHVVYWAPGGDMPPDVPPAVSQFETDVKAALDAGDNGNPFAIARGYGDDLGPGDPRIASIDSTVVTDAYPPKPAAGFCTGMPAPCLGQPDLAGEATRLARLHGWPASNRSLIMIFTAPSVNVCYLASDCAACGFHGLTKGGYVFIDVYMSCGTSTRYAIELVGHEQNEAVVDPEADAGEVADPCEGQYGDVTINGHSYRLPAIQQPNTKCSFSYTP